MSLLFTETSINNGATLITFGTKKDVCLFTFREAMHGKHQNEQVKVRQSLEGNLEGKRVIKFRHSGAEIVISLEYIHKLAELYPLKEKQMSESAESDTEETETKESK